MTIQILRKKVNLMAKKKPETKLCKYCQTPIPYSAKVCPNCRKRVKKGKLKWILLFLAAIVIIGSVFGGGNNVTDGAEYDPSTLLSEEEQTKLFSDTSAYQNRSIDLYGKIFNILDSDNGSAFQMYTDSEQDHWVMVYDSTAFLL